MAHAVTFQPGLGAGHCHFITFVAEGLQQVVQRIGFERADSILIVRRYKNRERHLFGSHRVNDAKTIQLRHLYVQKNYIRPLVLNHVYCGDSILGLKNAIHLGILAQEVDKPLPRGRFVINDQHADSLRRRLTHLYPLRS